jgi:hypothetical protein
MVKQRSVLVHVSGEVLPLYFGASFRKSYFRDARRFVYPQVFYVSGHHASFRKSYFRDARRFVYPQV